MDDHQHQHQEHQFQDPSKEAERRSSSSSSSSSTAAAAAAAATEVVLPMLKTRWLPTPEQVLILETIYNSGMVNPPRDETVKIRELLEQFGPIGEPNIFYWFQNRRSRCRREQRQRYRQLAMAMASDHPLTTTTATTTPSPAAACVPPSVSVPPSPLIDFPETFQNPQIGSKLDHISTHASDIFHLQSHITHASQSLDLQAEPAGTITVFINGMKTEVPSGGFDVKAVFGEDIMLLHSSGVPVFNNQFGFSMQEMQSGESYFLIPNL